MVVLDTGSDWLLTVFKHCRLQTHSACSGLWSLLWRKKTQSGQIQMMEFLQKYCWQCSTAINICKSPGKRKNDQAWMREAKASQQVRRHILHFLAFDHCSEEKNTIRSDSDAGVSIEPLALLNCNSHLQHTRQMEKIPSLDMASSKTHSALSGLWSLLFGKKNKKVRFRCWSFYRSTVGTAQLHFTFATHQANGKNDQAWMWQVRRHTLHFLAFDHCSEEKTIRSDSDAGVSIEALLALLNCISHLQHTRQTENDQAWMWEAKAFQQVRSMLKELTICCSQGQCDISDQAQFTKNQRLAG